MRIKRRSTRAMVASVLAAGLVLAACAGEEPDAPAPEPTEEPDDVDAEEPAEEVDLSGTSVTISGPESSEEEAGSFQDTVDIFAERTGIDIAYTGARDFEEQIVAQAVGGNPPDIAVFPQPGSLLDFAADGYLVPVPADVLATIEPQWPAGTNDAVSADGEVWGVQNKTDLKSLVWYNTELFESGGYDIPDTWDGLKDLSFQMIEDGVTPWCVGIESGPATGWPFTDWMEDLVLRIQDENVYDGWMTGEIPFSDDRILSIGEEIVDFWNEPGMVYAAGGTIAATPFGDSGGPLADGTCAMHRQASFYAAFIPEGVEVGPGGDVDVFYFPAAGDGRTPVLTAGTYLAVFRDAPEVWATVEYLASAEGSEERQRTQAERLGGGQSGYLSANLEQDLSVYNDLERSFIEILQTADPARFDASDMMPGAVGAGTFWTEGTSAVNGDKSVAEAFEAIDASWPDD